ncbi:MAG: hypothetical protein ACT4PP_13285 [Sporichthyaceae bacterium]
MTWDVQTRVEATRRRNRRVVAAVCVALAMTVPAAVRVGTADPHTPAAQLLLSSTIDSGSPAAASAAPGAGATPVPAPSFAFDPPLRRVVLPAGLAQVHEFPVRFPRTADGAAAAAVAMTRYSAGLDLAALSQALRIYVEPAAAAQADQSAAAALTAARARLGVPATGPAPQEASFSALPIGVQWRESGPDLVSVAVLCVLEYRLGDLVTEELSSAMSTMIWDEAGQDWKVRPEPAGAIAGPAPAPLGSAAFNDAGWSALAVVRQ